MQLQTLTKRNNERGFTIVELLIVIVVIAILAAISIVAYTGIQDRARNSSAHLLATQVAGKAGSYHAVTGTWPTGINGGQFTPTPVPAAPEAGLDGADVVTGTGDEQKFRQGTQVRISFPANERPIITYRVGSTGTGTVRP